MKRDEVALLQVALHLLVGLEVVLQHIIGGALASPVTHLENSNVISDFGLIIRFFLLNTFPQLQRETHHSCRALDDLPGLALLVDLAEAGPLAQLHVRVHLDQGNPVLLGKLFVKTSHCTSVKTFELNK